MSEIEKSEGSSARNSVQALAAGKATVFSTIKGEDFDSKLRVLDATTNSEAIADNLGKVINLVDFVVQIVEMTDEESGEVTEVPRTILIAEDGSAYHAISTGLFRSVENIIGLLGQPATWPGPLPVVVAQEGTGTRKYFTLRRAPKSGK